MWMEEKASSARGSLETQKHLVNLFWERYGALATNGGGCSQDVPFRLLPLIPSFKKAQQGKEKHIEFYMCDNIQSNFNIPKYLTK